MVIVREGRVMASPADVWKAIDDVGVMGRWFTFAEKIEIIEGSGLGRRQRLHGRWGRKKSEIDQLVTEYEPTRSFGWIHEAERLDGKPAPKFASSTHFLITLSPDGDGTTVSMRSVQEPASVPKGLVMKLFGGKDVSRHMERSLESLADLFEARPVEPDS
jgi:uncharacterized protein YndB with AHSA1/START domain